MTFARRAPSAVVAVGAAALAACTHPRPADPAAAAMSITAALAAPDRPPADRERDLTSKPAEVLAFLGIAPGMTVLDMNAASGWYTEVLARVVGASGHVIAHNHPGARATLPAEDFDRRYGGNRLANVEQTFVRHNDLALPPESFDLVLMSMVYHDTYWHDTGVDWGPIDRPALLTSLFRALKPGGIVGVIDHHGQPGADPRESVMAVHRIDAAVVRRDFLTAGFELVGESDVLRNPDDDYTRSVFDPAVVSHTDRFVMRFRKPREPRSN